MNIAIIEDNKMTRETLKILLSWEPSFDLIEDYDSAEQFLGRDKEETPDLLLVDLDLPGMHGVELIRIVKKRYPSTECLVYTVYEDREYVFSALKAGASGYVLKGGSPRELIEAIQCLMQGGAPMSPRIARKVLLEFQGATLPENPLSSRESSVIRLIEQGLTYMEISERLYISHHTVHTHIKNIYEKLQAKDRREAIKNARSLGAI